MGRRSAAGALFALLVAGLLVGSAGPAAACSCGRLDDAEAFDSADVVFTGALVEVRTPTGESWSSADPERFVFDVDHVYKGDAKARQSVVTPREGASCGLELAGRGPFLVYASTEPTLDLTGEDGELFSHLCTGSRALADGVGVPRAFGVGSAPRGGASAIGGVDDAMSPVLPIAVGAALVLALVGGTVLLRRRRVQS